MYYGILVDDPFLLLVVVEKGEGGGGGGYGERGVFSNLKVQSI